MKDEIKEILELKRRKVENAEAFGLTSINIQEDKTLLDYITTLQEENEKLKEENKHIFANVNDDELLRSNAMNWAEANKLQQRINKAIEYLTSYKAIETIQQFDHSKNNEDLDNSTIDEMTRRYLEVHNKVLNILQGDDK